MIKNYLKTGLFLVALILSHFSFAGVELQNFRAAHQEDYSVGLVSVQVASYRADRKYLILINTGGAVAYVKVGSAHVANEGIQIPAGGSWEPRIPPSETVYSKSAAGTNVIKVLDGD